MDDLSFLSPSLPFISPPLSSAPLPFPARPVLLLTSASYGASNKVPLGHPAAAPRARAPLRHQQRQVAVRHGDRRVPKLVQGR